MSKSHIYTFTIERSCIGRHDNLDLSEEKYTKDYQEKVESLSARTHALLKLFMGSHGANCLFWLPNETEFCSCCDFVA